MEIPTLYSWEKNALWKLETKHGSSWFLNFLFFLLRKAPSIRRLLLNFADSETGATAAARQLAAT